jgi:tRNA A-37 threonylcarbamoyl transferase component Bud32/dipeptidyl aminopeptidase/acylaminoacyl peptidase
MSLTPGQRLGPYEITAPLGAGGMGEVFRARDTKLDREVAIKVLPAELARDEERLARFRREAHLLAALNHPNIAAIHGLDEADGKPFLVLELVPGEDLAQRLKRGPIPLDEALPLARQVAEALEEAHEKGIVHRDLKPANVKLTPDGKVKVLDFGLAKAYSGEASAGSAHDLSQSPTLAHTGTAAGLILGTAAYMSPEQARGKTVDRRADVWAFGVVLFEMLTGRALFAGETVTDVLAAVVTREPDLEALPASTPPAVRQLLKRCLEKDPRRRLRDIGEARVLLEAPAAEACPPAAPTRRFPVWAATAIGVLLLAAGAAFGYLAARGPSDGAAADVSISPLTFRRGSVLTARFAPDGQTVVYGASWEGEPVDVFTVRLDTRESRSMGMKGADVLAVSSAGELLLSLGRRFTIGWESTGTLARMPLGGDAPREVLEGVQEADWSPDGQGFAVVRDTGALRRLEYPMGRVLFETGGWISNARVARDGRSVAFLDHPSRGDNQSAVKVVSADGDSRDVTAVFPRASNGLAWSASGNDLLFPTGSTLTATDLSGRSRALFRVLGFVMLHDVSAQGRVLVGRTTAQREIVGRAPGESRDRGLSWLDWSFPTALSDDGRLVLFEEQNLPNEYGLFLRRTDGAPPVRLGDGRGLALSPDGRWVLADQQVEGGRELVLLPTGAGETRRVGRPAVVAQGAAFLPGGERVVISGHTPSAGGRLFAYDLATSALSPISPEGVTSYFNAMVSPDGNFAFATGLDGKLTLYPVEGGEPRVVPGTSKDDIAIRWTADGQALYVLSRAALPARVERVAVANGERQPWLELTPPDPAGVQSIGPVHVSADGKAYVYSYRRKLDQLFVVDGLR